jgi:hypothetical protein
MMLSTRFSLRPAVYWAYLLALASLGALQPAKAEQPTAARRFPRETLGLIWIDDTRQLVERFQQTAVGQMARDAHMQPLVSQVFKAVEQAAQSTQDRLGLSLSELLTIPQGQLAVGLVNVPGMPPALLAMVQTADDQRNVQRLLDRAGDTLVEQGATQELQRHGGVEVTIYTLAGGRQRQVVFCRKEGMLLLATRIEPVEQLLAGFSGGSDSLAENPNFAAIQTSVTGAKGEEPQIRWYLDPTATIGAFGQGDAGTQIGLALLPALGLDGLLGIGGSMTLAAEQFDMISRVHVLLDNPRAGVIEMIALGQGEVVPESWVPAQVSNYTTLHWDAGKTYDRLQVLIDSFQGEGAFKAQVQRRLLAQSMVDIEREILPALAGRFSYVTLIEEPITPTSNAQLLGIKLKDPKRFAAVYDQIAEEYRDLSTPKTLGGKKYIQFAPPSLSDEPDAASSRSPHPCFCILGDYLLIGRESVLQKAIMTESEPGKSLAADLEFKLIASKAQRQAGGSRPSYLNFNRPDENFRMMYGLATSDATRQGLERRAENNPFFQNLNQAIRTNPLPPFAVIKQYLAPGGALLIDDETGFHYTSFTLRRTAP